MGYGKKLEEGGGSEVARKSSEEMKDRALSGKGGGREDERKRGWNFLERGDRKKVLGSR